MAFIVGLLTLIVFFIVLKLLGLATKTIIKFLINSIAGFILLVLANLLAGSIGIGEIEITIFRVIIATIFGIPGVIILFLLK